MRIGISNLAWEPADDSSVGDLLQRMRIDAIDVAPGKYFALDHMPPAHAIETVRQQWLDRGIEITGMQALLFGTKELNLFGDADQQGRMLAHLERICVIGALLRAPRLVFGSPRNRDRSGVDDVQCHAIATSFFSHLGRVATREGVTICLEPNPASYGANFLTGATETAKLVEEIDMASIRMQVDTGAITVNGESCEDILSAYHHIVGHVHASEPGLVVLGEGSTPHQMLGTAIRTALPNHIACIEMLVPADTSKLTAIERAVQLAVTHYGPD